MLFRAACISCLLHCPGLWYVAPALCLSPAPPEVSVSRRDTPDGSVTLSCRARGFYPRPIHVSWVRDGEDILAKMDSSGILSNADNTYYTPLSLEISLQQQDGHRYACRVEHSSRGELRPALGGESSLLTTAISSSGYWVLGCCIAGFVSLLQRVLTKSPVTGPFSSQGFASTSLLGIFVSI
uniref:Ig-like domain-containing protein n=1 Tax=Chelonoidis abingdonii TaxID=106734 RepID=A0A8C0IV50_CHEAB